MKSRNGMTLIEVLMALMIIGIIAVMFLPAVTNSFALMSKSKRLTNELFIVQKNIEKTIDTLRKDGGAGIPLDVTFKKAGKIEIKGKTLNESVNNTKISAFIPIIPNPVDPFFPAIDVKIIPKDVRDIIDSSTDPKKVNIYKKTNPTLIGNIYNKPTDFDKLIFRLIHNWYISDETYPTAKDKTFPEGYTRIFSTTKDSPDLNYIDEIDIKNSTKFKDKIVLYTITQVSNYGRYGEILSPKVIIIDENPIKAVKIENLIDSTLISPFTVNSEDKLKGKISDPASLDILGIPITHKWYISKANTISGTFDSTKYDVASSIVDTLPMILAYDKKHIVYELTVDGKSTIRSAPVKIKYEDLVLQDITNDWYFFEPSPNENTYVMEASGDSTASNTAIIDLWHKKPHGGYTDLSNQQWRFQKVGSTEYYRIYWTNSSGKTKYLWADGTMIKQTEINLDQHPVHWKVEKKSGKYLIISREYENKTTVTPKYLGATVPTSPSTQYPKVILTQAEYYWNLVIKNK